jgi:PAS domain S-box-containing protein
MMGAIGSQFGQFIERKHSEDSLHRVRKQLEIVTDTMSATVTRCSRDLRYVWVSGRYAQWLGRRPVDIAGRPIADVIGDKGLAALRPYIERVLSGEAVEYEAFVDFKGPGGRWIHAAYTPTFDRAGVPDGWVADVNDVTEQKRTEEALREAARQKDEFLAMLAHELRNPLAPVRTAAELLRVRGNDPAVLAQARGVIDRQVAHMARLVDDLLDVSRITRGKVTLHRERLDLAHLARLAAANHRQGFADAGVSLAVSIPEGPLWVSGDATRLTQVIDNLLGNARKFSDRGGTVTLDVSADGGGCAVVRVRDTGIGIEPAMLPRLFEVFSQADRSLDRSRGGLGLGLAIVKGLVELHRGRIAAASDGSGRGSEFTVTLPLEPAPAVAAEPPAADGAAQTGRLRVLVIEDNRDAADSLKVLLEALGHEAAVAYTGREGVEAARRERPDVVVCDIGLPGMDGFEVARALRRCSDTAGARLIAVTGYGQDGDRERALAAGFDSHLVKPADPAKLLGLLG